MRTVSSVAYSEVYEIINQLEDDLVNKIPQKLIEFFDEERDKNYSPKIDITKPLEEQNLRKNTIILLSILNMNYLCDDEQEKKEILENWEKNEINAQVKLKEVNKFNNIFNKKEDIQEETKDTNKELIEYKKSNFFNKIIDKIKNLLKIV